MVFFIKLLTLISHVGKRGLISGKNLSVKLSRDLSTYRNGIRTFGNGMIDKKQKQN